MRPASAIASSLWPFPETPATPTISPWRTSNETPRTAGKPSPFRQWRFSTEKTDPARRGGARGQVRRHVAPNHLTGQFAWVGVAGWRREDDLSVPHDADAIAHSHDLVELVRNKDHGLSVTRQLAKQLQQAICLTGREDRGRFVENDELDALEENPENFHALAFADRQGRARKRPASPRARSGGSIRRYALRRRSFAITVAGGEPWPRT